MFVHNIQKTGLFSEMRKVIQKVLRVLKLAASTRCAVTFLKYGLDITFAAENLSDFSGRLPLVVGVVRCCVQ